MSDVHLYHGDCLDVLPSIPPKSVGLILCDPPFGVHKMQWDKPIPFDKMWSQLERIIKPEGNIILFGTGLFAFKLALSNERLFRYDMVWKKSKCGSPLTAKYMPMKKHELILVFGNSAAKYNPQLEPGMPYHRSYTSHKCNNLGFGIEGTEHDNDGWRHPSTVLDFPQKWRRQDQIHPTQKPVELMEWLVKSYSDEEDTVLDFAMGSGTTGVACALTNRNFIGIELDERYYEIAQNRIGDARTTPHQGDLFE